jgi:hypothetical protein
MSFEWLAVDPCEIGMSEANRQIQAHLRRQVRALRIDDCSGHEDISLPPHDTVVHILPDAMQVELGRVADELTALEDAHFTNIPGKYHMTLAWYPVGPDRQLVQVMAQKSLDKGPWNFHAENLICTPQGIAVCLYTDSLEFVKLRQEVSAYAGKDLPLDNRAVHGWATLCVFRLPPKPELLEYVRKHLDDKFGSFTVRSLTMYFSKDRMLQDVEELFTVMGKK